MNIAHLLRMGDFIMKKFALFALLGITSLLTNATMVSPIGETAAYRLNNDPGRTSFMVQKGEGMGTVVEMRQDAKIGPAYVIRIDYDLEVLFRGRVQGDVGLLVPVAMFEEQFYDDLQVTHPVNLQAFRVDYMGTTRASDDENNSYDQCLMIKIYDIDPAYRPVFKEPGVSVLWHNNNVNAFADVKNLVLDLTTHSIVPVLGAVQLDISAKVNGLPFKMGFDFTPGE